MLDSVVGMTDETDSVAEIFTRAFDSASTMPAGAAELILRAQLPETDVKRVEELLEEKRLGGLTSEQEALLSDYLQVDSLLTILKSKARAALSVPVTK
jgi:hypothetical protein